MSEERLLRLSELVEQMRDCEEGMGWHCVDLLVEQIQPLVASLLADFSQSKLEWFCDGCERVLHPSSLTRVGIGVHHRNYDKPSNGMLNCGPVRQRPTIQGATAGGE